MSEPAGPSGPEFWEETDDTEALRRYRSLVNAVDDGIYQLDANGRFVAVNDSIVELTGYAREELLGEHISLLLDNDASTTEQLLTNPTDQSKQLEVAVQTAEGDQVRCEVRVTLLSSDSTVQRTVGVVREITDRRRSDQPLGESDQQHNREPDQITGATTEAEEQKRLYNTIISNTPDLVYAFDLNYRFTFANDAVLEMWGQTREESIGKTLQEVGYEPWHAEMHEREIDTVIETKELIRGEVEFPHAERGRRVYEYIFAPVLDADGEVEAITGTSRDVTERRQAKEKLQRSKEQFRALVTASSDVVYRMSPDWSEMRELQGKEFLADTDELTSNWLDKYIHPDERSRVTEAIDEAIQTKSTFELEHRVEQDDGSTGWTFSRAVPMLDEDGEIEEWIGMASDITERREYQRKLEESNERLEQFAYAASHDLQEPLRMVISYLQLLENRYADAIDEDGEEFIEFAVDGAERMREMIDALLEYSRIETQGDPFEPVDLNEILEDVLADLQVRIVESDAEVTVEELPHLEGDASQLWQLFQNLLDNAITYSGDEQLRIHVDADRHGDEWVISVEDNGIGIDPDEQERVFTVFDRLHSHEEYNGTGIGLALCQRIVERHNGEIWVESEPGEGATFSFTLPAGSEHDL